MLPTFAVLTNVDQPSSSEARSASSPNPFFQGVHHEANGMGSYSHGLDHDRRPVAEREPGMSPKKRWLLRLDSMQRARLSRARTRSSLRAGLLPNLLRQGLRSSPQRTVPQDARPQMRILLRSDRKSKTSGPRGSGRTCQKEALAGMPGLFVCAGCLRLCDTEMRGPRWVDENHQPSFIRIMILRCYRITRPSR
jgi:hypothetical protein